MRTASAVVFFALLPAVAAAQPRAFAVWERPAAGIFFGPSANGGDNSEDTAGEIDFVFDTPVVFGYRVRADVSRVSWRFDGPERGVLVPASETVTVKSICLSVVGVRHTGARTAGYAGAGYGAYRYEYDRLPLHNPWRSGFHALAGLEILSQNQRLAFSGELRLHAINGPRQPPVSASALLKLDGALGMKVRF
jgi:hypothetical protein